MGSIPYLYSSVLSTNTLSLSYHGSSSTRVFSASSGPAPSGPRKRATSSWTRDWLRSWPRDNTYYTTRRQCPRPTTPGSSLPLLSSWANPSSYQDNPMNLTCNPRTNLQAPGGSSFVMSSFWKVLFLMVFIEVGCPNSAVCPKDKIHLNFTR